MFKDYYKLLGISFNASGKEIKIALDNAHRCQNDSLINEAKMVLGNTQLKNLYDNEYQTYVMSEEKQNYEICNPILKRELRKIELYIANKSAISTVPIPSRNGHKYTWIWVIIGFVILCLGKCATSYYKGVKLEENAQKYYRGEYDYSFGNKTFDLLQFVKPIFKRI